MRKFLSDRNIAVALFVFTFLIFVLAQEYTRQNGPNPGSRAVSSNSQIPAEQAQAEQPIPAAIIAR
jgi:hypothetical protein